MLLVCGEESAAQIRMRAERICAAPGGMRVLAETELESVMAALEQERPALVVVDSVQTLYSDDLTSAPGSVSQVREAAGRFLRLAKQSGAAVFLVGHVTKDGAIAGPRVLEHMVDTVLQFEGDRNRFYRILRAAKNRFGSTNEMGVFEMSEAGLRPVPDPSQLFAGEGPPAAGSTLHVAVEGTRCFLVEVQALVATTELALPRRVATGFDRNRLAMIVAVLGRHAGWLCHPPTFLLILQVGFASRSLRPILPLRWRSHQPAQRAPSGRGGAVWGDQPDGRGTFRKPTRASVRRSDESRSLDSRHVAWRCRARGPARVVRSRGRDREECPVPSAGHRLPGAAGVRGPERRARGVRPCTKSAIRLCTHTMGRARS